MQITSKISFNSYIFLTELFKKFLDAIMYQWPAPPPTESPETPVHPK
jgi:hypothetical protein